MLKEGKCKVVLRQSYRKSLQLGLGLVILQRKKLIRLSSSVSVHQVFAAPQEVSQVPGLLLAEEGHTRGKEKSENIVSAKPQMPFGQSKSQYQYVTLLHD